MPNVGVRVEGAGEVRRALRSIGDDGLKKELRLAHKAGAQVVVDDALPHVPVRTGRLRRSVRALGSQTSGQAKAGSAAVPYAAAIHWGRKQGNVWGGRTASNLIRGRPFLTDAAARSQAGVVDIYERGIRRLLDTF